MRKISILGSTGSIGTQTLDVVDNLQNIKISALTAHSNIDLLEKQARKYTPVMVAVMDEEQAFLLAKRLDDTDIRVLSGMDGVMSAATLTEVDTIVNALVGNIGLRPTLAAINSGKNIALANKETLVTSGEIIIKAVKANNIALYPIDSEHSAIFQCLQGNSGNDINKIYLTASGGPFRGKTLNELETVTVKDALKHPNWAMGAKITIDSSTMMNKGLEVIEAKWLFGLSKEQIQVLVHPQSIIHSMVEFCDGAVMAQLGEPDMRVPIQYAMTYPNRVANNFPKIDFLLKNSITFEPPNLDSFPCLRLAFEAIETGGTMPAVLNAANEALVAAFLNERIRFLEIPKLIETALSAYTVKYNFEIDDVLEADLWAREFIGQKLGE